jgi:hypothetical protein
MKHVQFFLAVCIVLLLGMASLTNAEFLLSTGLRYDSFTTDQSPETDGSEITIPLGIAYTWQELLIRFDTAYASATVDHSDGSDSSLSSMTDSLVGVSYAFPELPVGLILGLDVNLPTGKATLSESERGAEAGERNDLFEVDDFGEGLNVGLSLGLIKELGAVNLLLDGGYIFYGEYNPTDEIPDDDLDPGDQLLLIGTLNWPVSPRVGFNIFAAYSHFSEDQVNGEDSFQEGDKFVIGGDIRLAYSPFTVILSLQDVLQAKNKDFTAEPGSLETETENSNGNEFFAFLDVVYDYSPNLLFRGIGDIRYYGESDRKSEISGLPYEGKRIRYAFGPGFSYAFNEQLACNGLIKIFIMDQERDILLDEDVTFQGFNLAVGVTYTF